MDVVAVLVSCKVKPNLLKLKGRLNDSMSLPERGGEKGDGNGKEEQGHYRFAFTLNYIFASFRFLPKKANKRKLSSRQKLELETCK